MPDPSKSEQRHLPECKAQTLAELHPDEPKPPDLPEAAWTEVYIGKCAPGCLILERDIARGIELADRYGW